MPVVVSVLMCHAPVVVPAVGGARAAQCVRTTRAMREVAARVVGSAPDRLVLVSPHSPRAPGRFVAWPKVRGDLGDFRAPEIQVALPVDAAAVQSIGVPWMDGVAVWPPHRADWMDHGAMVPLAFLTEAGWSGPSVVLSVPADVSAEACAALGQRISALDGRTAVVASGDMSHRLKLGAPAGYHPDAAEFDRALVEALRRDDWPALRRLPHRQVAAEDVVDSLLVATVAAGEPTQSEVLAYEAPWGVGYTEAVLFDPQPPLYAVARQAVRAATLERAWRPPEDKRPAQPVFVTLRGAGGDLRGCIGSLTTRCSSLSEEVALAARKAATMDPRFPPVDAADLDALTYEVSVLDAPEPIDGPDQLDPSVYGVVVEATGRRGVMLPDVPGIDTAAEQLRLTCDKAGIPPGAALQLHRFAVSTHAQP